MKPTMRILKHLTMEIRLKLCTGNPDTRGNFAGWTLSVATDAQFHLDTVDPSVTDESSAEVGDYLTGAQLSFSGGHVTTEKKA